MFASYQTPPSSNHHQLYLTPASMSPPAQMSPATTFLNDRQSNCNSPHFNSSSFLNTFHQQQQQQQQTPNQNSFMMYTNAPPSQGSNTPQTNTATNTNTANAIPNHVTSFQCQSPSPSYLMYQSQHSIQSSKSFNLLKKK